MTDEYDHLIENFTGINLGSFVVKSALNQRNSSMQSKWKALLKEQRLPVEGWSGGSIEGFLYQLSGLDGNNFGGVIGMGEREGRICNELIKRRHFGFAHGMGRSGNLKDSQPKAVGSSILIRLTHRLIESALRVWGFDRSAMRGGSIILPVCTGMSIAQVLLSMNFPFKEANTRNNNKNKNRVILLRIDQKSCVKAIRAAECEMILLEGLIEGDQIVTDLEALELLLKESSGNGSIRAVVSCVSCFAPRSPDKLVQIGRLCRKYRVGHVVNAAYGGTSERACNLINNTLIEGGRIDAVVMSLDKNFEVPVGGAVVFGPEEELIERIGSRWPGRAGASHIIDLFIALLSKGQKGILAAKTDRIEAFNHFKKRLKYSEQCCWSLMKTPQNDISLALKLPVGLGDTALGSKLFHRNISGARVIQISSPKLSPKLTMSILSISGLIPRNGPMNFVT